MTVIAFTKGQGTGNDFVLISDPDADLALTDADVAELCDRRLGVGADGVLLAVRAMALDDGAEAARAGAEWFMDYRNADGSVAEMCGNGIRVFGEFLLARGLIAPEVGDSIRIGTRAGVRALTRTATGWSADLGEARVGNGEPLVSASGLEVARPGLPVDVGNPHVVVALASDDELERLELHAEPEVDPAPRHGANVEFVVPADPLIVDGVGTIRMRVHERGSGETLSCGTGAVAAAAATRYWAGSGAPDRWIVEVPGGALGVTFRDAAAELSGPARLVYSGELELSSIRPTASPR